MKATTTLLLVLALAACGDTNNSAPATPDAPTAEPDREEVDPEATDPEPGPYPQTFPGRCEYTNPFSQGAECKEYSGATWTLEAATADCGQVLPGTAGTFVESERCTFPSVLGACAVGDPAADGYVLLSAGDDPSACEGTRFGCETFLGGTFNPSSLCGEGGGPTEPVADGFIPPFETCREPLDGEPAGQSDGLVCTQNAIQGCTEEGRAYEDYADCSVVRSQRPYYAVPVTPDTPSDDARLTDPAFQREFAWVNEQIEATACVCCHSADAAPDGASIWDIRSQGIWIDTISDNGLAMLAGLADSRSFGAFEPEDNNGFSRDITGVPTTDPDRMRAFLIGELRRRGVDVERGEFAPFGGPLYDQLMFEPGRCEDGVGVGPDGMVRWNGEARYVYVLEAGSQNPGVPPNLDLPDGTIWRIDASPGAPRLGGELAYGAVPEGAEQAFPEVGSAPALTPGGDYYLYVLYDVALPVTRCVFTYGG